ncbi:two-component system, NtrC family, C4-dicarboxylate transport sensor histidine kinase DctB [Tranquillimonas rosea]|uniref:C4-dicarboxylate transport sensor protein DctB n=1 Tax=Tranquillimonas rosea TaxID=641238 RepID=A0A1H9V7C1_9RHOB|nr:ATP-binding protein [Tranquillimonas rosea]SES17153.1 two-component system, NtrC family, C4-dicarboxylate transport sensor histidine kinase DctB [Tranquillimonas rosea]
MTRLLRPRALIFAAFVGVVAAVAGAVWWGAYDSALDRLEERGRSDLRLAADRLVGELQQYREMAVLMADHPVLHDIATGQGNAARAEALLRDVADKTGSLDVSVIGGAGRVLASAGGASRDRSDNPAVRRSQQGALGVHHGLDGVWGDRVFTFAAPIFAETGRVAGAVAVDVSVRAVEGAWVGEPEAVFFTDTAGVIFISNREELLLRSRGDAAPTMAERMRHGYGITAVRPFYEVARTWRAGHEIWRINAGRYLPDRAVHLSLPLPVIDMQGELLIGTGPAARIAALQALVAAALCLVVGAALFLASERRRALAERLEIEAAANAALEARVARRTAELSAVNADLRREIAEREEAEAALKKAQADLVQAGKLSALGQMSAGISHELNQPLMAIRSFAENGALFIDRGKPETARQNLDRISEMARRMGRIIRNLRAFARQESEPVGDVDLVAVVDAALEMAVGRAQQADVTLDWRRPDAPVMVRGGEVRLQQVVMNLVSNAIDALAGADERRVTLEVEAGDVVRLSVRDTGPGISAPDRIFDPFYSTKEVGASEGMGLGLSISYGLVQSFGGAIRGRNAEDGGAVFTVELHPGGAGAEEAA